MLAEPTEVADVLIVGAGPTGPTAACDLARRGLTVRIIDRTAVPGTGSRGTGLQPRTLEVLDNLGVAGILVATGRFRLPVCFHGRDGSRTVTAPAQHDDHVTLSCADHGVLRARRVVGADVRLDGLDRDHRHLWQRCDGGSLALCPIPAGDTFQLQAPLAPGNTPPTAGTPATSAPGNEHRQQPIGQHPEGEAEAHDWSEMRQPGHTTVNQPKARHTAMNNTNTTEAAHATKSPQAGVVGTGRCGSRD